MTYPTQGTYYLIQWHHENETWLARFSLYPWVEYEAVTPDGAIRGLLVQIDSLLAEESLAH